MAGASEQVQPSCSGVQREGLSGRDGDKGCSREGRSCRDGDMGCSREGRSCRDGDMGCRERACTLSI